VWGFNDQYILGFRLFGLPIEEILFFICIPYASLFTYHCFKVFYPRAFNFPDKSISVVLVAAMVLGGILFMSKLYTGLTCNLLAFLVFYLSMIRKVKWLPNFYFMYLVILLPFFIVNGLLTGTGLDAPVVWYNDLENVGVRILTIPVEDVFYGMLMLLLNTFLFETFAEKYGKKEATDISL
jgi:lycopene cyclase domain-containing protein